MHRCGSDEQGPDTEWGKIIGGSGYDTGQAVVETADSGFIVVGYTDSFIAGETRIYLIRLNKDGDTLWTDTHGATYSQAFDIVPLNDGNFVITGYTQASGNGDVICVKINDDGNVLWVNSYGGTDSDIGLGAVATSDNGVLVTGWTTGDSIMGKDVFLVRIDGSGDTLWTRVYGGSGDDFGTAVCELNDGGFLISGWTDSFGAGSDDVYLLRTDASGDTLWTRAYGDQNQDYGEGVIQAANNNFVIAGVTQDAGEAMSRIFLLEVDSSGDTVWVQTYEDGFAYDVRQVDDNGFVLAGSFFYRFPIRNAYLLRTDADGVMIWEKHFGDDANDGGYGVLQTKDRGFLLVGETESYGAGSRDVYIMKVAAESE